MTTKELISKLKQCNKNLFVVVQTYYPNGFNFSLPMYSVVNDVYVEDDWLVRLSDCKRLADEVSVIKPAEPMTVREVIKSLSKCPSDLKVTTELFMYPDFLCYDMLSSTTGDIDSVYCDKDKGVVVLSKTD